MIDRDALDPAESINIIVQVCEGLQEAHNAGVVHRDIKPANIVLEKNDHPKIVDFGLAWVQGAGKLTKTGTAMGTVLYMSPEQLRGNAVDQRTDLFSVGLVLYELIAGRHPFAADNESAVHYKLLNVAPEPMARFRSGLPEGLQEVVDRALEKDPHTRYQSAADMAADLRRLRRRSSVSRGLAVSGRRAVRSRWYRYRYLIAVAAFIVLGAALWISHRSGRARIPERQKHLAVLPLVNLGGEAAGQALCAGLEETITSKLTQLTDREAPLYQVVPSSEIREKGITSAAQARRVFGVGLAVTGSFQQYDGDVRVTMNLVDAETQRQLRSAIIDEKILHISTLQDLVVAKLADMLGVQPGSASYRALAAGKTLSSRAYYAYLQGQGYLQRYETPACLDSAMTCFREAVSQDSSYALAYAGLSAVYLRKYDLSMDTAFVGPAIVNASRALQLNDQLAPVLVALGLIHRLTGQYEEAVNYFQQALKVDSTNNETYRELASAYESLGKETDAEACYRTAVRLRPGNWLNYYYLSSFSISRGRRDEALQQAAMAESLAPTASFPYAWLGSLYASLGMTDKAKALLERSLDLAPDYFALSNLGAIYQWEKQDRKAAEMYERALRLRVTDYRVWINFASVYQTLPLPDAREKARAAFDTAIALGEQNRKINPNDAMLLVHLADCYAKTDRSEKALALATRAVDLAPGVGEILVRASIVFEGAGKREAALALIGQAVERRYPVEAIRNLEELRDLVADARFDSIAGGALSSGAPTTH